jgi:hypothetical protein
MVDSRPGAGKYKVTLEHLVVQENDRAQKFIEQISIN